MHRKSCANICHREFFSPLSCEMFNPLCGLFEYSTHDKHALRINPSSGVDPEHLNYFKFIGRCLGLGIFHRQFLDACFIVPFYKMVLKKKVVFADLESADAELYRSLKWMLYVVPDGISRSMPDPHRRDNDITDVIDQTFTITEERFGEIVMTELKPGGLDIPVTEENKKNYVDAVVEYRIPNEQFEALIDGFSELIPLDLINLFDERELEVLIGGVSEIDVYATYPSLFYTLY
jgi:E3 ubiquitin-protein ligase NEDD4